MARSVAAALLALIAAACAPAGSSPGSAPAGPPASIIETSTSVSVRLSEQAEAATVLLQASPEVVWVLLPEVYESLGIAAEIHDAEARAYGTRRFAQNRLGGKRTAEFVRCGHQGAGPSAASNYRVRLSIVSTLGSAPGVGTRLVTEVSGSATPVEGTSTAAVRCVSTGELEQRINALVAERLAG